MKKLALLFLLIGTLVLLAMGIANAQSTPVKVGSVYYAIDDSSKAAYFYQVMNAQGCPANIYIHDTMWQILGGYQNTRPAPAVPIPPVVVYTTLFTTQTPKLAAAETDIGGNTTIKGIECGVRFTSSVAGYVSGIRFYKATGNSGTHIGELYSAAGVRLAAATFINETATGWQTVQFTTPIAITAGTQYIAAYFSGNGFYSEDNGFFVKDLVSGYLTAPKDAPGAGNGLFIYTAAPAFPTQLYQQQNNWTDVIFSTTK